MRKKLRASRTYEDWKQTALELDNHLGFDEWKKVDDDPFYDWRLVRKVLKSLRTLRKNDDVRGVLGVLETCLRTNFAGVESARCVHCVITPSKPYSCLYQIIQRGNPV